MVTPRKRPALKGRPQDPDRPPRRATIAQIAGVAQLSETTIRKHIIHSGLKKGADGKYNLAAVLKWIMDSHTKAAALRAHATEGGSGKDRKNDLECRKLELQIGRISGALISIDDHNRTLQEHASIASRVWYEWLSEIRSRADIRLLEWAQACVTSAQQSLAAALLSSADAVAPSDDGDDNETS